MPFFSPEWVTEAPITQVGPAAMGLLVKQFNDNLAAFRADGIGDDDVDRWNRRIANSTSIANGALRVAGRDASALSYVYKFMGVPVGFLSLSDLEPTYINDITAHPGAANAGGILLEFAVNFSARRGHGGRIELYSLNAESSAFYLDHGFTRDDPTDTDGGNMALDPASAHGRGYWTRVGETWRLSRYLGQKILNMKMSKPLPKPPL
ncbi:MAG: hypothetical protein R3F55_20450 [Alphaproteobacteria bacterium]